MKRKQLWVGIASACGILVLILDGKTALVGAQEGVSLCLMTVIPSLFPFFLLSGTLTSSLLSTPPVFLRPMARFLGLPTGAEALALTALLGGYPAGAQSVAEGYRLGKLSREQAEMLLPVCNQPGPAFLFGIVGSLFPKKWMVWALWFVILASAAMVSLTHLPKNGEHVNHLIPSAPSLAQTFQTSLKATAAVCGWVVFFRVILAFADRWLLWILPQEARVGLIGLAELTNGCVLLNSLNSLRLRFCMAAVLLSFGGLCVTMQTLSISDSLSMGDYYLGKGLQALFALILSLCVAYGIWLPLGLGFLLIVLYRQKRSGNPKEAGV